MASLTTARPVRFMVHYLTRIWSRPWRGRAAAVVILAATGLLDRSVALGVLAPFYSVPVALWAFYDGWRGGLAAAGLSSIAMFAAPGDVTVINRTISSIALLCLGPLLGIVFERERRQKGQAQESAEQLSSAYEKVQANFEGMKRIERLSAIGQLSAGLAHEIRNPLASIAGAAAILRRNENMDPKYVKCIEIITHECERLNGLLTNFLNFARPRPPRLQTVQLDSVLNNVLAVASHGLHGKTVHCEKQMQPNLPRVECDPEQLEQVLLNLMINAIEASPNGETVLLSAVADAGKVAVRVVDRGYGVAPAHIGRLFDPFFTTKEHGTGLGLPVAHQIVMQMGGTLLAQQNPGSGMIFSVILPVKQGDA
jgi:two-component system, NtrC family, sensor histidine kinase HydH